MPAVTGRPAGRSGAGVILTVTLNAAIDVTYRVERFVPGSAMRVEHVHQRAGGKGVNVARVLAATGAPACATGLAGGRRGEAIRAELARLGIREEFEAVAGESRQTVVVTDGLQHPTEMNEPGPAIQPGEWDRFQRRFARLVAEARVAVLAGSMPPGLPADAYGQLCAAARRAGTPVLVDAGGPALRLACGAGPDIVTPNHRELHRAVDGTVDAADGQPCGAASGGAGGGGTAGDGSRSRVAAALGAGERLRRIGAGAVVASLGSDGIAAVTPDGCWRVSHRHVDGNPVGAGDALAAGLAAALSAGRGWPDMLASATGLAMASVRQPWAGEVDAAEAAELSTSVRVSRL
jgi:tagatose 6-phosphate kinase